MSFTATSAVSFYASFDSAVAYDFGQGQKTPDTRFGTPGEPSTYTFEKGYDKTLYRIAPGKGIVGGALEAVGLLPKGGRIFFPAKGNLAYKRGGWGGAFSFWAKTDPNQLITTKFCDPIQMTERGANNGGLWIDFNDAQPRDLRHGAFPVVPPGHQPLAESDPQAPLVRVPKIEWKADQWRHIAVSWANFDTDKNDARSALWIDGKSQGEITGQAISMGWNLDRTGIFLAINYIGLLDELALFSRPLTAEEIKRLHQEPDILSKTPGLRTP